MTENFESLDEDLLSSAQNIDDGPAASSSLPPNLVDGF